MRKLDEFIMNINFVLLEYFKKLSEKILISIATVNEENARLIVHMNSFSRK